MAEPPFWVFGGKDQPLDSGMHDGSEAHGAWLQCHVEVTSIETVIAHDFPGLAEGIDFGMTAGVAVMNGPIFRLTDQSTLGHDHGTNGDFIFECRIFGKGKGDAHPVEVLGLGIKKGDHGAVVRRGRERKLRLRVWIDLRVAKNEFEQFGWWGGFGQRRICLGGFLKRV